MRRSSQLLLIVFVSFVAAGVIDASVTAKSARAFSLMHGILCSVFAYMWIKAEAIERGSFSPGRSALWAGLFPIVGIPIYLFCTRAWKPAFKGCAWFFVFLFALAASFGISSAVTKAIVDRYM